MLQIQHQHNDMTNTMTTNDNIMVMPEVEIRAIVKEAVRQVFLTMGMNVNDANEIVDFQQDMHFLRKQRLRREKFEVSIVMHVVLMAITAAGTALGTLLLNGGF